MTASRLRRTALSAAVAGTVLTALLAGCAAGGDGGSPSGAPSGPGVPSGDASSSAPAPVSPTEDPEDGEETPGVDPTKGKSITLTGTIESGVEHGCLIMKTNGKVYSLFGGDRSVMVAGARVEVTGHEAPGVVSFCQQGVPFQVENARTL